jgi:uncharacterized protein
MYGISVFDLSWLAVSMLAAGAVTGLLAGVFGVGGGAVAVPILYELFRLVGVPEEVRMPLCVGTSLAIIIPTSIRSFRAHHAKGAVDMSILRIWAIPVVVGVVMGSVVARYAPADLFKTVFVVVAGVSAIRLLFGKDTWRFGLDMPAKPIMVVYGWLIGVLSALMGIGGGQLSNLFMTFYNRSIHQAVATSSGLGILISIPGALGYIYAGWPAAASYPAVAALQVPFALGYVSLIGAVLVMPMSLVTAPLGVRAAHAMSKRTLEVAFGCYLFIVGSRFVLSLVGAS